MQDSFFDKAVESVHIESGITEICDSTFRECSNLASITLPDIVTSIRDYAFGYSRNEFYVYGQYVLEFTKI